MHCKECGEYIPTYTQEDLENEKIRMIEEGRLTVHETNLGPLLILNHPLLEEKE